MAAGRQQWAAEQERLRSYDEALTPQRRERLRQAGWTEARAIDHLFNISDALERDPATLIVQYMRSLPPEKAAQVRAAEWPKLSPAVQQAALKREVAARERATARQAAGRAVPRCCE
jgi:hypothetical protein